MIRNGQKATEDNFNAAFASKTADNILSGKQSLQNTDPQSGNPIENVQKAVNILFDVNGVAGEHDANAKVYSSHNFISDGDSQKVAIQKLDSALAEAVQEANATSSQLINYCPNPGAELNLDGYELYADALDPEPEDGEGGTPTIEFLRDGPPSVFRGEGFFVINKGEDVNGQGQGVALTFPVDNVDLVRQRRIKIGFDYETIDDYQTGDVRLFVYDIDNDELIPVVNESNGEIVKKSSFGYFEGFFYPNVNGTNYRLLFHIATDNLLAWTIRFDNVVITPDTDVGAQSIEVRQELLNDDSDELGGIYLDSNEYSYYRIEILARRKTDSSFRRSIVSLEAFYNNELDEWILEWEESHPDSLDDIGLEFAVDNTDTTLAPIMYTSDDMSGSDYEGVLLWKVVNRFKSEVL